MNTVTKLTLTALTITTLAGCASAPLEAPKTEAERVASGSRLHVPVAINLNDFTWHKVTVKAKERVGLFGEKGEGKVTIFTDKKTGKMYDFEGQPVTAEGYRVLADGYVCEPRLIIHGFTDSVYYGEKSILNGDDSMPDCQTFKYETKRANGSKKLALVATASLFSGGAALIGTGYLATTDNDAAKQQQEIEEIIKDDINS